MPRTLAVFCLILTTMLWGFAFVAQKSAMAAMGPLTFIAARYALGGLLVAPLIWWELRRRKVLLTPRDIGIIALIAFAFFMGVWLQQVGLTMTTVTNGGFLTSLYVMFVPILALAALMQKPHPILWFCAPMAVLGVFFLNGGRLDGLNWGDLLVLASAVGWAIQVLLIGIVSHRTGLPITISVICFASTAIAAAGGAALFETPNLAALADGWIELLYAGLLSTAVAFTMQAVAQQYVPPANAAIILSAEGLFAALGGALILGERLTPIGYAGATMIFLAIVLVEAIPALRQRRAIA